MVFDPRFQSENIGNESDKFNSTELYIDIQERFLRQVSFYSSLINSRGIYHW